MIKIYKYSPNSSWHREAVNDKTLTGKKRLEAIDNAIQKYGEEVTIRDYFSDFRRNCTLNDYSYACYGKAENSIERLANSEINYDEGLSYLSVRNNNPEDLIESRTSWEEMKAYADGLYYFIQDLCIEVANEVIKL